MSTTKALKACTDGDLDSLTALLSDSSITKTDEFVSDMLRNAAINGRSTIVEYVLNSYNPSHIDDKVFRSAAASNSTETFRLIYARNPSCLTELYERRGTLLSIALGALAPEEFIEYLLSMGANPNLISDDTVSPLAFAAFQYDSPTMVELLVRYGAQVNGTTALAAAAQKGHLGTATYLLAHGALVNDPGNWIQPAFPLHIAVKHGKAEVVRLLLGKKADLTLRDGSGKTPVEIARETGNAEMIEIMEEALKVL